MGFRDASVDGGGEASSHDIAAPVAYELVPGVFPGLEGVHQRAREAAQVQAAPEEEKWLGEGDLVENNVKGWRKWLR